MITSYSFFSFSRTSGVMSLNPVSENRPQTIKERTFPQKQYFEVDYITISNFLFHDFCDLPSFFTMSSRDLFISDTVTSLCPWW